MSGTAENRFSPDQPMTRAMLMRNILTAAQNHQA